MNEKRLLSVLEKLAADYNDSPENGVTRFAWSNTYQKALGCLKKRFAKTGIKTWVDNAGNFHALYKGRTKAPRIVIGSHLDTVKNGGKYDGTYGVVCACETLCSFYEQNYIPYRSIEFIAFAEEEGSNFGTTCLGSKLITGAFAPQDLKTLKNAKTTAWNLLKEFGLSPKKIAKEQLRPEEIFAFLEIHIEQGCKLEENKCDAGIVQAISGMLMHRITYTGKSEHAASPMQGRRDPAACFADAHKAIQEAYRQGKFPEGTSFTFGQFVCKPNIANVVPGEFSFTLDFRQLEVPLLEKSWETAEEILRGCARENQIEINIEKLSFSGGYKMDDKVKNAFRQACETLNADCMDLNSGPAHDAACMARIVPSGLLFVPSKNGLSHSPFEYTEPEQLCTGARIYQKAVRILAETK